MSDPTIPPFSCHFSLFLISPELKQKKETVLRGPLPSPACSSLPLGGVIGDMSYPGDPFPLSFLRYPIFPHLNCMQTSWKYRIPGRRRRYGA